MRSLRQGPVRGRNNCDPVTPQLDGSGDRRWKENSSGLFDDNQGPVTQQLEGDERWKDRASSREQIGAAYPYYGATDEEFRSAKNAILVDGREDYVFFDGGCLWVHMDPFICMWGSVSRESSSTRAPLLVQKWPVATQRPAQV
ncbi:uncharacterized protein STEHIDRAFT_112509 [Stereum hirsutum FP-91666 SS1]|uniref:uncharacterized protein n=1 Tax=Stereum hirsutum (strain FP-91666) TaxID=721885 RepID=UPI000444996C|nr:uncharacterized protein STEHIDRAFT_112509 [Stereum hirsutum FP-91666 SS1]EIM85010.1 hypothetical protein STEHIDRAFT_112509 [Stereum hirsutum FP-91666 SS1]